MGYLWFYRIVPIKPNPSILWEYNMPAGAEKSSFFPIVKRIYGQILQSFFKSTVFWVPVLPATYRTLICPL